MGATGATDTSSFIGWITTYGSIIGFFVQIAFYAAVGVASLWAATTFHNYVKFMTSDEEVAEETATPVDEFVE